MTISSCEGHADEEKPAGIVFLASIDKALHLHHAIRQMSDDLLCHWELTARFICPDDAWALGWKLENWGIKNCVESNKEGRWNENTKAAREDIARLAALFNSFGYCTESEHTEQ